MSNYAKEVMFDQNNSDLTECKVMKEYPFLEALKDSLFYEDEAFGDPEEENTCDCCPNPAKYMTFDGDDEDAEAYYICEDCVERFDLYHKLENFEGDEDAT